MRNNQRHVFSILALMCSCALWGIFSINAQQTPQQEQQKPTRTPIKPANDDEPVAITDRAKVEKKIANKELTEDQFGNFRYPIIINKGDIAFIALFTSSTTKSGSDQAVFMRKADGSWKVFRRGE